MFREMRRKNQCLSYEECLKILERNTYGVLALAGDDGYPYAVPMNHVMMDGKLYFHCAMEGHKADAIRNCPKASFCVVDAHDVDAENLTTRYRSVIVFGNVRMVEDETIRRNALMAIGERFAPEHMQNAFRQISESIQRTGIIELSIGHMTGKESRSLARERREGAAQA